MKKIYVYIGLGVCLISFVSVCYCPACGISIDRDLNASLNIRNIGINTVGHAGINACGDGSLEPSLKQEKECLVN